MTANIALKELGLAALLLTLVSGAAVDDHLPVEHRGSDDGGIPLGPEVPDYTADAASEPDIETELETQLRDSLPPGVLLRDSQLPGALLRDSQLPPGVLLRDAQLPPGVLLRDSQLPPGVLLRDAQLPPGVLLRDSQPQQPALRYRPQYAAAWSPYPSPYLLPAVYLPPVPWYLAAVRGQRPFRYAGLVTANQQAPSVVASRIYDVTISSAHAPQQAE